MKKIFSGRVNEKKSERKRKETNALTKVNPKDYLQSWPTKHGEEALVLKFYFCLEDNKISRASSQYRQFVPLLIFQDDQAIRH